MYTKAEENLILLSTFGELSYKDKFNLLSGFESTEPDFKKFSDKLIKGGASGVYNKVKEKFYDERYRKAVFSGIEKRNITCVTYFSEAYPRILKEIPDPPVNLYCKGDISLLNDRCFSVVGSRRTTPAMVAECRKISSELTHSFTVVTGLAEGADSAAIEGALPSGKIISVLAYGFDYVYPKINHKLLERVEKSGLLITEYPPKVAPKSYNFPFRNRIIAGLSEGTLVASAAARSGALITADFAADYGRNVFALPYGIGVTSGEGCNNLIKNGAYLAQNTLDILSVFGLGFEKKTAEKLSDVEQNLLDKIKEAGEAFVPDLADKLGVAPYKLIPALSSLEIKGLIIRLGGNRYSAI